MMRFLSRMMLVACLLAPLFAQDDDIAISYFRGGNYKIRFGFSSALLSGIGVRSAGLGGVISGFDHDVANAVQHPAALAAFQKRTAIFDITPRFMINPTSFVDIDPEIESGVDDALEEYAIPDDELNYPGMDIRFGQSAFAGSGGLVVPTKAGQFGFAVYQPLSLRLNVFGNGFATMIETEKALGDNVTVVQFATAMSTSIDFFLDSRATSVSYGKAWHPKFSSGLSLDWFDAKVDLNAEFKIDGIMLLRQEGAVSGQEYVFNDPYDNSIRTEDGEQNDLNQWARGGFDGSAWGVTLSTLYLPLKWLSVDVVLKTPQHITMDGDFEFIQNRIAALDAENLTSDDDDTELFDVTQLSLAKPTLTEQFVNPGATSVNLKMPGSFVLGSTMRFGSRSMVAFNFTQYFSEFSYSFNKYKQGLKLKQGVRFGGSFPFAWYLSPETIFIKSLGFDPKPKMRIGGGVIFADEIKSGFDYQTENPHRTYSSTGLMLPSVALGKSFLIYHNIEADVLLFGLPATFLKMSFHYQF